MASNDYIPGATTLVPGANDTTVAVTGAGNYNQAFPKAAYPGADSVAFRKELADILGGDITDASAVLAWVLRQQFVSGKPNLKAVLSAGVSRRAPSFLDDSTKGYVAGDRWAYDGQEYVLYDAGAGQAAWGVAENNRASIAFLGSDLVGVFGLEALIPSFTGACVDVTTSVSGAATVTTVSILADGSLDLVTLNKALAAKDSGTRAEVTQWYDQSGSGNHLTQTFGNGLVIGEAYVGGKLALTGDNSGASKARALANSTVAFAAAAGFASFVMGQQANTNSSNDENPGSISVGTGSNYLALIPGLTESGRIQVYDGNSNSFFNTGVSANSAPSVMGMSTTGNTTLSVFQDGTVVNVADSSGNLADAHTGMRVGSSLLGNAFNGIVTAAVFVKRGLTAAEISEVASNCALIGGYTPQKRVSIFAVGDSRTAGYLNTDGYNWPVKIQEYLDEPANVYNFAVSGSTTTDFISDTEATVLSAVAAQTGLRIGVVWLGVNDFSKGADKATVTGNVLSIAESLVNAGCSKVFVLSEPGTTKYNGMSDQDWFNKRFLGQEYADIIYLNPFSATWSSDDSDFNGTLYHPDKIHPTAVLVQALASYLAASVQPVIDSNVS